MNPFEKTIWSKNLKWNIKIVYMCQYVYEYSNEYIFSGLDIVIIELFRKTIIPDKKKDTLIFEE